MEFLWKFYERVLNIAVEVPFVVLWDSTKVFVLVFYFVISTFTLSFNSLFDLTISHKIRPLFFVLTPVSFSTFTLKFSPLLSYLMVRLAVF